ncbi:hypothetical protein [Streptomyces sp. NPDC001307]|uniref:hypothetical protein n=1 Tax=Streptomyces sp. NPDC001307 TaxID=3364560 RepID=UPI0036D07E82
MKQAFVSAARPGWWILTTCGLAVLLTSGHWAHRTAERTAESLESAEIRQTVSVAGRG